MGSNPLSSTSKADFEHGIGLFGLRTATLTIELPAQPLERVPGGIYPGSSAGDDGEHRRLAFPGHPG